MRAPYKLCLIGAVIAMVFGISQGRIWSLCRGWRYRGGNKFVYDNIRILPRKAYVLDAMALKQTYILITQA